MAAYAGESMPLWMVVDLQNHDTPLLYSPNDEDAIFAYKILSVQVRQPQVVIIGSSRVHQFRAELLNRDHSAFYNLFLSGGRLRDMTAFVDAILQRDNHPPVIILGLDHVWFNDDYVDWNSPHILDTDEIGIDRILVTTRTFWSAMFRDWSNRNRLRAMQRREPYYGHEALGIRAIIKGTGFRNDGSRQSNTMLNVVRDENALEARRQNHVDQLNRGEQYYLPGTMVSQSALEELESILIMANDLGIEVIGFSPPYLDTIHDTLFSDPRYSYIPQLTADLEQLFARYDYHYFDFSDSALVGGSDAEMYDGWHPGELLSLRLYLAMVRQLPDILGPYSDTEYLDAVAANATDPFIVFDK